MVQQIPGERLFLFKLFLLSFLGRKKNHFCYIFDIHASVIIPVSKAHPSVNISKTQRQS